MPLLKLLIGFALLGYGSYVIFPRVAIDYVPVSAVVTQSDETYIDTSPHRPGHFVYTFQYEYTYSDQLYVSDRYTYGGRDTAEAVCQYKTGDRLTAYVDARNPSYSVIKPSVSGFVYALTAVGLLMIIQTVLGYVLDHNKPNQPELFQKTYNFLGPLIGITVLFGGIGYFIYILIVVATDQCVQ